MTLERRWVDAALPEWEVLAACAHALESLRGLLKTAHEKAPDDACTLEARSLPCITASLEPRSLDCLVDDQEFRRVHLSLLSLGEVVADSQPYAYEPEVAAEAAERYGLTEPFRESGPIEMAPAVFQQAKVILAKDGHHVGVLWLFTGDDVVWMQPLHFQDQVTKYVTMDAIGRKAASLHADGFLCLAETWIANQRPDEDWSDVHKIIPARVRPDRMEALHLVGMTADRRGVEYLNIFTRAKDGSIVLGEDSVHVGSDVSVSGIYAPLMQHWTTAEREPGSA